MKKKEYFSNVTENDVIYVAHAILMGKIIHLFACEIRCRQH